MSAAFGPAHSLLFDEVFTDDLVGGRFHKSRRDAFTMAIEVSIIGMVARLA